jgi:hypothetical protein
VISVLTTIFWPTIYCTIDLNQKVSSVPVRKNLGTDCHVGKSGYFRITGDGKEQAIDHSVPEEKEAIELWMAENFVRSYPSDGKPIFSNPRQNKESDFDFTVPTDCGDAFLELMEIAPLEAFGGSFENVPPAHNAKKLADAIIKGILKKSRRYRVKQDLFLLLYPTHQGFALGMATIQFARFSLKKQKHCFRAVSYLEPLDDKQGCIYPLFPVSSACLHNFRPDEHKEATVVNLDHRKWQFARGSDIAPPDQSGRVST